MSHVGVSADALVQQLGHDTLNLFLGSAFVTVGLIAVAFSLLRKRADALLIYFGIFAALWGLWFWLAAGVLALLWPHSRAYERVRDCIGYLLPLPTVLYFRAAGFMLGRLAWMGYLLAVGGTIIAIATLAFGSALIYEQVFFLLLIAATAALIIGASQLRSGSTPDTVVIRRGFLVFAAFILWDNIAVRYFQFRSVAAIGMAFLLASFGYVAGRRMLARDRELSELQKELELAKRIQLSILPSEFPPSPDFQVAARYRPMTSVAGDFYDYVIAGDGRVGLLIADVSGHGVPAALIASMVKVAAASHRTVAADPAQLLLGINSALLQNTRNQYVTAAYVYLDSHAPELRYAAAGHPPMLLLRNGDVREIEENGLVLGIFGSATYNSVSHRLEPGDRILLYTDGLIEAINTAGEFFGRDALATALKKTASCSIAEASDRILSEVCTWAAAQDDDLTLILCDFCPPGLSR